MKKTTAVIILITMMILTFSGCSEKETPFTVAVLAPYVSQDKLQTYASGVTSDIKTVYVDISTGDPEKDPMSVVGGTTKLAGMVSGKEIDIIIAQMDVAARNARNDMFYTLDEIFTEDELAGIDEDRLLSFDILNDELKPNGEKTPVCGIDLSDNEELRKVMGKDDFGIFIVSNTTHLEDAKALFLEYVK